MEEVSEGPPSARQRRHETTFGPGAWMECCLLGGLQQFLSTHALFTLRATCVHVRDGEEPSHTQLSLSLSPYLSISYAPPPKSPFLDT